MESNRDESNRCAALAKQYLAEGDAEKARKFMAKAHRLFATDETKQFLDDLNDASADTGARKRQTAGTATGANGDAAAATAAETNYRRDDEYTDEQKNLVSRVNKCKNYYEVLEVSKTATDAEIKKAYKKIALKLHPDKNKCPGAIEAFKKVGNAVAVLTDAEKRKQYDTYGSTSRANGSSSFQNAASSFHSFDFEQDTNVEEIFNLFFGNAFNRPTVFTRTRTNDFFRPSATFQREQFTNNSREQHHGIAQILPLIIAVVLSIMVTWFQSEPVFSLKPSEIYRNLRRTHIHELPFYVKDSFQHTFHGSIYDLEQDILFEMKSECRREHYRKKQRIYNAQMNFNAKMEKQAKEAKLEFCDILRSRNIVIT